MRKMWIIGRHEYVTNVRRTGFVAVTLLVPVLMGAIIVIGAVFGGQASSFLEQTFGRGPEGGIGVVDRSGVFTPILPEYAAIYRLYDAEGEGRAAVRDETVSLLMVITEDYLATGEVEVYSNEGGLSAAMMSDASSSRAFFIDHLLRDGDADLRERLVTPMRSVWRSLDGEAQASASPLGQAMAFMIPYFIAILMIITLFTTSGYLLRSVSNEKVSRVIEIILSSATPWELLAGKVLGLGALGLTQVGVWMGSALLLSGGFATVVGVQDTLVSSAGTLGLAMVYYLLGFVVYAVLMGGVGALGTSMEESQQLAGIFSLVAAVPMMISGLIMQNPNMMLVRVLSWFPLTAPTMMVLRLGLATVPTVDVIGSIVLLLVTAPLVLWAGAKLFRMGLLMYGKRPTLAEALKALRQS